MCCWQLCHVNWRWSHGLAGISILLHFSLRIRILKCCCNIITDASSFWAVVFFFITDCEFLVDASSIVLYKINLMIWGICGPRWIWELLFSIYAKTFWEFWWQFHPICRSLGVHTFWTGLILLIMNVGYSPYFALFNLISERFLAFSMCYV